MTALVRGTEAPKRIKPSRTSAESPVRTRPFQIACGKISEIPNRFRAVSTWIGYFSLLYEMAATDEERARVDADLCVAEAEFDEVIAYFDSERTVPGVNADAANWFRDCLGQTPGGAAAFLDMARMQRHTLATARADNGDTRPLHFEMQNHAVTSIAPTLEALFRNLRTGLDQQSADRHTQVNDAQLSADDAVKRINDISRMVRLIALNAAVEAARAQEAGRGFAVIASEIKSLSEQIGTTTEEVGLRISRIIDAL